VRPKEDGGKVELLDFKTDSLIPGVNEEFFGRRASLGVAAVLPESWGNHEYR
jgi:hypothetical protein